MIAPWSATCWTICPMRRFFQEKAIERRTWKSLASGEARGVEVDASSSTNWLSVALSQSA